jgi:DNA-binding MarR family transcriptional regulator
MKIAVVKTKQEKLTKIFLSIFRLNAILLAEGNRIVSPLGLTSARWQVLGALALSNRALTCPQVASAMGITRQGALKQLDLCKDEALLAVKENPKHERSPLYELTVHGKKIFNQAMVLQAKWAKALSAGFSDSDLSLVYENLTQLETKLSESGEIRKE